MGAAEDSGSERGAGAGRPTGDVDVVVGLQPSLCTQKVLFCHQEDDVFGPVNLPWTPETRSAGPETGAKPSPARSSPQASPRKWAASASSSPTAWLLVESGPQGTVSTRDSVLAARGARRMPYTLVPDTIWTRHGEDFAPPYPGGLPSLVALDCPPGISRARDMPPAGFPAASHPPQARFGPRHSSPPQYVALVGLIRKGQPPREALRVHFQPH